MRKAFIISLYSLPGICTNMPKSALPNMGCKVFVVTVHACNCVSSQLWAKFS